MASEQGRKLSHQVLSITLIRTVLNTGFRMVFPFQPLLMAELGISLRAMTRMLAGRSFIGVLSPLTASVADSRGRKFGMLTGLGLFTLGAAVMAGWTTPGGFLVFLLLSTFAKAVFDPSLQAYLGDRVPYSRRGFVLAVTEMSWSGAFFLGVPLVGFLIQNTSLLTPFLVFAGLGLASLAVLAVMISRDSPPPGGRPGLVSNFSKVLTSRAALAGLIVTALTAAGNQVINVVFGVWLNESFAFQVAALGGASAVIGAAELLGEGGVSVFSDRLSKKKAVLLGVLTNSASALALIILGNSRWGAVVGLFLVYLTFEFTIVSAIPMMTGVLPEARATLMALNLACISLGRGLGSLLAAPLYARGFAFNLIFGAGVNLLAAAALRFVIIQEK